MTPTKVSTKPIESLSKLLTQRVLLLSLIAVVGLGSTLILSLLITLQQVQTRMDEVNIEAVRTFDLFFLDIQSDLRATSDALATSHDVELMLLQIASRNPSFLDVFLVNFDGRVLAQHDIVGRPRQTRIEQKLWLESPPSFGEVYIGPVYFEGQAPFVDMVVTVTDDIGLPSAILLVKVDLTELWNTTLDVKVGETGYAYITDNTGQLVAYRNRRLLESGSNLVDLLGHTPQEIVESRLSFYTGLSGQRVFASAQPLKLVPWFAVVEQPADEAMSPFIWPMIVLLIVLSLVGLLVLGITKFTRTRIVLPLLLLRDAVGEMTSGRLNQQIEVKHRDELGQLAYAFNSMAAQLKETIGTLEQHVVELQRAEAETRRAQAFLNTIVENIPNMIFVKDAQDLRFVLFNKAGEELIGMPREEMIGKNDYSFFPKEEADFFTIKDREVLTGKQLVDIPEESIQTKYKGSRLLHTKKVPMLEEEGTPQYLLGISEDITESKQTEAKIRRRNRELALLNRVIAASAAAPSLEPEAVLETACRELAQAFDVPQAAVALLNEKKTAMIVVAEYLSEGRPSALNDAIPVEGNPLAQYILTHKTPLTVDDAQHDPRLTPIHDLLRQRGTVSMLILPLTIEGEIVGTLSLDVIEPRLFSPEEITLALSVADQVAGALARARLAQTHRRLIIAIEQTAESVIITDTKGVILYVNPAFEQITGYSRAEVVGQTPRILRSGKLDAAFYQKLWATLSAGEVWHGRFVNKSKNGTLYTDEATISPVRDESGTIISYVSVQRDVTRELQLEERYRQAQRMEAVGQLTGGIAHDFNNLLTAINGFAELAQSGMSPDDPNRELLDKILQSGGRAADLVRQLMAFSRKQIIEPKVLNINTVVTEMDKMLRRIIGEDIQIETHLLPDLWPVKMDPAQIEQIIVNLAINARDAMLEGGWLTIETANVVLDEQDIVNYLETQPGEYVLLVIGDTGTGMNESVQARIFEPFFTTKEVGKGTGLGLATVFGIVKQNGGDIRVYSEEGKGTTFKIYLPRVEEAITFRTQADRNGRMPTGAETVLLVEDNQEVRELVTRTLQRQGYTVLVAANGEEALRLAQEYDRKIDLLFSDVVMPQMGGQTLARRLRAVRPNIKVLFMSGYTDNAIAHHGVLDPGVAFIQKPFSPIVLTRKVREVLDKQGTPSTK